LQMLPQIHRHRRICADAIEGAMKIAEQPSSAGVDRSGRATGSGWRHTASAEAAVSLL
jgi:hypothetical protein